MSAVGRDDTHTMHFRRGRTSALLSSLASFYLDSGDSGHHTKYCAIHDFKSPFERLALSSNLEIHCLDYESTFSYDFTNRYRRRTFTYHEAVHVSRK